MTPTESPDEHPGRAVPTFRLTDEVQERTVALLRAVNGRLLRAS